MTKLTWSLFEVVTLWCTDVVPKTHPKSFQNRSLRAPKTDSQNIFKSMFKICVVNEFWWPKRSHFKLFWSVFYSPSLLSGSVKRWMRGNGFLDAQRTHDRFNLLTKNNKNFILSLCSLNNYRISLDRCSEAVFVFIHGIREHAANTCFHNYPCDA